MILACHLGGKFSTRKNYYCLDSFSKSQEIQKQTSRFTESVLYYGEKKLWTNLLELFLFNTVGLQFGLRKKDSILDVFCEIWEVLQDLSFTEDIWANASDFQQHFRHITCSISNKST